MYIKVPSDYWGRCVRNKNRKNFAVILQHVYVMEQHIGRPLTRNETVHHKNGFKDDNRIENLELWEHHHGPGQRAIDKLNWAREIIQKYGPIEKLS